MDRRVTLAALASLGALTCLSYACGDDETGETTGEPTSTVATGGAGPTSTTANNGGSNVSVGVNVGGSTGEGGACADLVVEAEVEYLPADIIFVIDNSGSMTDEIAGVEQNINVNFATIMQNSGIDFQVIMITDHGSASLDVCVTPPLSGTTNCSGDPVFVPGKFYHYDRNVQSWDSVCRMFATMNGAEPAENTLAPNGWLPWLRTEAVKVFVEITDDRMQCTWGPVNVADNGDVPGGQAAALAFDQALLSTAPGQFGTVADRNYIFYSLVGMPPKTNPLDPYTEFEPVVTGTCVGGVSPGTGYQWLSKGTGALRFPVCQDMNQTYDAVFQDIAAGVIDVTKVPCEFDVPPPPPGQELDLNTIDVLYTPGGGGQTQEWTKVASESQCGPGKFWIDETVMPPRIHLCDEACAVVEADNDAKVEVKIECGGMQN
jgi:hypothetical protein